MKWGCKEEKVQYKHFDTFKSESCSFVNCARSYRRHQIIEHLKTYVNENQKVQMLEEAKPVTAWVYEIIKKICKD